MIGIAKGIIQAAMTVCDGAGTVVTSNPQLIQGMGGYISSLAETDPIPQVIEGVEAKGEHVLSPYDARIDQVDGARWAFDGFSKLHSLWTMLILPRCCER
jgi:hypothetical protein